MKIENLDELETIMRRDTIEKCFMKYMLTIINHAKRLEDLQNGCAVMDEDEMFSYIDAVGRTELYDEKELLEDKAAAEADKTKKEPKKELNEEAKPEVEPEPEEPEPEAVPPSYDYDSDHLSAIDEARKTFLDTYKKKNTLKNSI